MTKWDSREMWHRVTGEPYRARFDSEWSPRWDWWIGTVYEIADSRVCHQRHAGAGVPRRAATDLPVTSDRAAQAKCQWPNTPCHLLANATNDPAAQVKKWNFIWRYLIRRNGGSLALHGRFQDGEPIRCGYTWCPCSQAKG